MVVLLEGQLRVRLHAEKTSNINGVAHRQQGLEFEGLGVVCMVGPRGGRTRCCVVEVRMPAEVFPFHMGQPMLLAQQAETSEEPPLVQKNGPPT
jgi:hypothetical protein